jgi:predicted ABC-type sugar transport system permease subunit
MNLTGVTTYPQMVVFGLLILVAVLIDQLKNRSSGTASS